MPLISVVSLKGSPGVTIAALALATAWPVQRRLLAELDPAGGDLGVRLALPTGGGLAGLATASRRPESRPSVWPFAHELADGVWVLPAPPGAEQATACLRTLATAGVLHQLATDATAREAVMIADCGRLDPASLTGQAGVLAGVVLVAVRPHLSDLAHVAGRLDAIRQQAAVTGLVLIRGAGSPRADPAYPPEEISQALDAPVLGNLPSDPHGAAVLTAGRGQQTRAGRRLPLMRAARALAEAVAGHLPPASRAAPGPEPADGRNAPATRQPGTAPEVVTR
jgi:MinD-like ATPase involved in chromosome partitioning or flagellar assembly